jgi:hypothetical protein
MAAQTTAAAPARQATRVAKEQRARQPQQRKPAPHPSVFAAVETVLQGGGQPLDPRQRTTMEQRFGHDFSAVRVHTDRAAASSAQALNARAYAVGRHVVFDAGEYRSTGAGLRLLAHELAHVAQQGSASYRPELGLTLSSAASANEREADQAAQRVSLGKNVHVRRTVDAGTVQRLQRAEHGTYVSKIGGNPYLDAGEQFYKTWDHPNVKRVSNMKEVLDDLDKAKDPIEKFRIVSHGASVGLELGLLPEIDPKYFYASSTGKFTTEAEFRKQFTNKRLVLETLFASIYAALWKDTTTQALLTLLGGSRDVPAENSNLGIVLRAIVDAHWLAKVELDTGGKPAIPNADALTTFINLRRNTYGKLIIEAADKDKQPDLRKAIAEIAKLLPGVITAAKITFAPKVTKDEAKTLADPFVESPGKKSGLKKELAKSIEEGAAGPYLKRLKSVRGKVNSKTHVEIRGCNVGSNTATMDTLRGFFGNPDALPSMSAPDLYQYFFQLNVKSYGTGEQAALESAFGNIDLGMPEGYEDLRRTKAGEMTRVVNETKLSQLATKYGFNADKVRKLNPEIEDPDKLKTGDIVWLVPRTEVPAGIYKTLEKFCSDYVDDKYAWPKVWAANPWLGDPKQLKPDHKLTVPKEVLKPPIASAASTAKDFAAAVRGGQAVPGLASKLESKVRTKRGVQTVTTEFEHPRPILHIDDAKRNEALSKWLASQKFDPKGRTAEVLSKRYGKTGAEFEAARKGTYVQFLSWDYPNAKDPIFPEDPRYDKHIIQRP